MLESLTVNRQQGDYANMQYPIYTGYTLLGSESFQKQVQVDTTRFNVSGAGTQDVLYDAWPKEHVHRDTRTPL